MAAPKLSIDTILENSVRNIYNYNGGKDQDVVGWYHSTDNHKRTTTHPYKYSCQLAIKIWASVKKGNCHRPTTWEDYDLVQDRQTILKEIADNIWNYVEQHNGELQIPIHETIEIDSNTGAISFNLMRTIESLPPLPIRVAALPGQEFDQLDVNHPQYHNWIRVGLALREMVKGLGPFTMKHAKILQDEIRALGLPPPAIAIESKYQGKHNQNFTKEIEGIRKRIVEIDIELTQLQHSKSQSDDEEKLLQEEKEAREKLVIEKENTLKKNESLDPWAEAILQHHTRGATAKVYWTNSDARDWAIENGHFQLVKCFCSSLGNHKNCIEQQVNADTVDATAILNMMLLCDEFAGKSVSEDKVKAALGVRNGQLFHNCNFHLTDEQAKQSMVTIISLLEDPIELLNDDRAKDAVNIIRDLMLRDFTVVPVSKDEHDKMVKEHKQLAEQVKELNTTLKYNEVSRRKDNAVVAEYVGIDRDDKGSSEYREDLKQGFLKKDQEDTERNKKHRRTKVKLEISDRLYGRAPASSSYASSEWIFTKEEEKYIQRKVREAGGGGGEPDDAGPELRAAEQGAGGGRGGPSSPGATLAFRACTCCTKRSFLRYSNNDLAPLLPWSVGVASSLSSPLARPRQRRRSQSRACRGPATG